MTSTKDDVSAQLWTAAAAAAADRHTIDVLGVVSPVLMERAALCVSAEVEALARAGGVGVPGVLVLVGPGNNGGDGLAVARQLHGRGLAVRAQMVGARHNAAVAQQLSWARSHGVAVGDGPPETLTAPTIIVDALLGTGSRGAPRGAVAEALAWLDVEQAGRAGEPSKVVGVVAVDLPSGLDVDTGAVPGVIVTATRTVTFQRSKPGLHLTPGRAHVGDLIVAEIGLVDPPGSTCAAELIAPGQVAALVAGLPEPSHKNRRGHVGVIGGTGGTPGAAILAGTAALRVGAGLVTLSATDPGLRAELIAHRPELMLAPPEAAWTLPSVDVLVVGPGLVEADSDALARLDLEDPRPMVWDASGLDHLGPAGSQAGARVLTPHPGEAARLLARLDPEHGWDSVKVQSHRHRAALRLAELLDAVIVLKGAGTIVATQRPGGPVSLAICTSGGPALASAGTGDVLAGAIAGLMARGLDPWDAARVGVHLHGLAGESCPAHGTLALDIVEALPGALAEPGRRPAAWPRLRQG